MKARKMMCDKCIKQSVCKLKDHFDGDNLVGCIEFAPKQRVGHWIYDRTRNCDGECKYECSECGMGSDVDYEYCMLCGAKMVETQEKDTEI